MLAANHPGSPAGGKEEKSRDEADLEAARVAGNDAFKAGDYPEAIRQYSIGIKLAGEKRPASLPLFSNRALCHIKVRFLPSLLPLAPPPLSSKKDARADWYGAVVVHYRLVRMVLNRDAELASIPPPPLQ